MVLTIRLFMEVPLFEGGVSLVATIELSDSHVKVVPAIRDDRVSKHHQRVKKGQKATTQSSNSQLNGRAASGAIAVDRSSP